MTRGVYIFDDVDAHEGLDGSFFNLVPVEKLGDVVPERYALLCTYNNTST